MEQKNYEIVKFVDNDFELEVNVSPEEETVWLTQDQMTALFDVDQSGISRHLNGAIKDGEISKESNMQKMHFTGGYKPIVYYDFDAIIAVGYRVKSKRGVIFRRWATSVLKQYMLKGYAIDPARTPKERIVFFSELCNNNVIIMNRRRPCRKSYRSRILEIREECQRCAIRAMSRFLLPRTGMETWS